MRPMHLTLLLSGALLPAELAGELAGALQAPVLSRWLQRATPLADRPVTGSTGDTAWMAAEVFGVKDAAVAPTAPYAWAALTGDTSPDMTVWHADPIHVAIGRDSLVVQTPADAPPRDDEADALIAAANESLAGGGADLRRSGSHWFLHAAAAWPLQPPPLDAVLGAAFTLPAEAGGTQRWSRLHNAIQMSWHQHPVNERREAGDAPPINALWLHGSGRWAPLPALRWPCVISDRAALRGAAQAAGATVASPADAWSTDALVDLPHALPAARVGDWPAWLAAMTALDRDLARVPAAQPVELVLTARDRVRSWRVQPADRLRFWRRNEVAAALSA